ncbi:MAG TPA: FAD-dependent oxidoreductase [Hyphomonadaceae bacterium]|nr:FAD-dependent oxidoreductase [Hyphomonadaceae bacterium]
MSDFDAIIVGAGAVGLACGYALAKRGLSVAVLEREGRIGAGVSSRNSEVIHAGFYYRTGSLKARACVEGRRALYAFLDAHNVAHDKCAKLLVATDAKELAGLEQIALQAEANGVEGMTRLSGAEARALEPELNALAALHFSESGVMDAHGYMDALAGEIEARGGAIVLNSPFLGARPLPEGFAISVGGADPTTITATRLIVAAGLGAQACAHTIEGMPLSAVPKQHLGKGSYFTLFGVKAPFRRLIYPLPIPGALGTHYRRDLGGAARFGPDLEWVEQEDYRVDPERAASFYETIRRFWPGLPDGALVPDYAGIRPKIHGPGEAQPDFVLADAGVHGLGKLLCLFGIESPGLTASLALGEEVARRLRA